MREKRHRGARRLDIHNTDQLVQECHRPHEVAGIYLLHNPPIHVQYMYVRCC